MLDPFSMRRRSLFIRRGPSGLLVTSQIPHSRLNPACAALKIEKSATGTNRQTDRQVEVVSSSHYEALDWRNDLTLLSTLLDTLISFGRSPWSGEDWFSSFLPIHASLLQVFFQVPTSLRNLRNKFKLAAETVAWIACRKKKAQAPSKLGR
jgi:hypothetical protein